jgi:hypothetical protein
MTVTYLQSPRFRSTFASALALLSLSAGAHAQEANIASDAGATLAGQAVQSASSRARRASFEYSSVWGGPSYNCGITRDGAVECWGATSFFPGVQPNFGPHPTPQAIPGVQC